MRTSAPLALARGLAGSFVIVIALAAMVGIGIPLASGLGDGTFAARLIPAVIMGAVTLALLMLLLRLQRRPWRFAGVVGTAKLLGGFGLGIATMTASAILMFGLFTALGTIDWGPVDVATLGLFILTNAVIALLLEAIPEEVVMRGYVQSSLGERFGRLLTIALTTGFFLLAPFSFVLGQSVVASFISGVWTPTLTPNGEHVAEYYILLAVFGVTLSLARWATPSHSIGTSIGAHLAYLTIARIAVSKDSDVTGVTITLLGPDAILVVPLVIVVAAVGFWWMGRRASTSSATASGSQPQASD